MNISEIEEKSKLYEEVINACSYILYNDSISIDAKKYLDGRISNEFQNRFQFGYFPANEQISYLFSLVDQKLLKKLGLIYPKYIAGASTSTGHFTNHNLIFPFRDMYGNIVSIVGRTILSKEKQDELNLQKYKYTFGLNKELYVFGLNKDDILKNNCVIPVEGQFDYFSCKIAGIDNVVALGGAALSKYQFYKLRRYTNNFVIILDSDEAGRRASERIKERFGSRANIIIKKPPDNSKDIDEFFNSSIITKDRKTEVVNFLKGFNEARKS